MIIIKFNVKKCKNSVSILMLHRMSVSLWRCTFDWRVLPMGRASGDLLDCNVGYCY